MDEMMMALKVEDISPVKKKLYFNVPWLDVKKEMDVVYRKVNATAKVKGFRKGKVPRSILESLYKGYVEEETVANLIERLYADALKSSQIFAVNMPEIEQSGIEREKDFTFCAQVEVEPNLDPIGYTELPLEKIEYEVTEKDVEAKLEEYRQMFASVDEITEERSVRDGDFISLDFAGSIDGVSRKELTSDNFFLEVGTKRFIPGFEENLIGMAKDETKDINLRFPDDYNHPDFAGKDAVFTCIVKSIKEKKLPPLDADFIKNFVAFDSIEELKQDIAKRLSEQNNLRSQSELRNNIATELLKRNEFEVPECYVEREFQYRINDAQRRMIMDGLSKNDAAEMQKKFHEQYRAGAIRMVKLVTLLSSIARKEAITVEESALAERIEEIARQSKDYEASKKYLGERAVRANMTQEMLNNEVFKFIENHAEITIVKENREAAAGEGDK